MLTIEQAAEVCHEANRAFCRQLGDDSQSPWTDAPEWQRTSAMNGVRFHLAHPDAPASASHDEWMREKLATGWQHGPVKSEAKKEHPCIVPFEDLPPEQKAKDFLFKAVIHAFMDSDIIAVADVDRATS